MTGPRTTIVHPHRRRGRRLLPFLIVLTLAPIACTSDKLTEPMSSGQQQVAAATGAHPRAVLNGRHVVDLLASSHTSKPSASLRVSAFGTVTGASVLILADADVGATTALADTLTDAGFQVTVRPAPEYTWDGTNPALDGFDAVIHLNGAGYDGTINDAGQQALSDFVAAGGGYIGAEWNGVEYTPMMSDLVLQTAGGPSDPTAQNCAVCDISYQTVSGQEGHPVLAGLSAGFSFTADGHDAGPQVAFETNPSTVLMRLPGGAPGVLVRQFGNGKIVSFSFAPNYPFDDVGELRDPTTLKDTNIKRLYINAVRWISGTNTASAEPQSITFDALGDKVYGQPAFSITATASSGLPVSFSATGNCTVLGSTVSITAAGSCTITAHQAGNDNYQPAEDVSQSFSILQATPSLQWAPGALLTGTPLGPSQLNATASGVAGVPLSGSFTYTPGAGTTFTSAGTVSLSVQFAPSDPNYTSATKTVSISVSSAMTFTGFFAPVRNGPYVNVALPGSAIPFKFSIGGYRGLQVLSNTPGSVQVTCPAGAPESTVLPLITGTSGLRSLGYSYTYVWRTSASWAGTCRKFVLTLSDGSTHEALFRFMAAPKANTQTNTLKRILGR
jgi:hypothetical protein